MNGWNLEHTYAELPDIFSRHQMPTAVPTPQMVVFNDKLAALLGLDVEELRRSPEVFTGNMLPHGAKPIAQAYAGYQFGHFSMLGDGRAILLGEQITPSGQRFDVQLKGAGKTPYSRRGDGQAALAPMLREYIISEAMHALGIPTTRSLAVALTGKGVIRERELQGAVLTRVAASHIRVGTFNYITAYGTNDDLRKLADYSILRHFPWLENSGDKYLLFLREVADRQASLIAKWQLVGFVHGVMNTDNMAISGETIDYGPCAFMDVYDPDTVFSSIDTAGRYAYKNQPEIGAWNLSRFAEALLPLIHENQEKAVELARIEIELYREKYHDCWLVGMRGKLGIMLKEADDLLLINELLDLMHKNKLDYTCTFRDLINDNPPFALSEWCQKWQAKLSRQPQNRDDVKDLMKKHNPAVIPRNYFVEETLSAAENGDYSMMDNLLDALSKPYEESNVYSAPPVPSGCGCGYKTYCGT